MGSDGSRVQYTVKELLNQVNQKVDALTAKLDSKAEHSEFERLLGRLESAEHHMLVMSTLDEQRREGSARRDVYYRHWSSVLLPLGVSTVVTIGVAASSYLLGGNR